MSASIPLQIRLQFLSASALVAPTTLPFHQSDHVGVCVAGVVAISIVAYLMPVVPIMYVDGAPGYLITILRGFHDRVYIGGLMYSIALLSSSGSSLNRPRAVLHLLQSKPRTFPVA